MTNIFPPLENIVSEFISNISAKSFDVILDDYAKEKKIDFSKRITSKKLEIFKENQVALLDKNLQNLNKIIIKYYIGTLLSGDYLKKDPEQELNNIEVILSDLNFYKLNAPIPTLFNNIYLELVDQYKILFFKDTYEIVQQIKRTLIPFFQECNERLLITRDDALFKATKNEQKKILSEESRKYFRALEIVLSLTELEHFELDANKSTIQRLIILNKVFSTLHLDISEEALIEAIRIKTSFLIYKISKRIDVESISYKIENELEKINIEEGSSNLSEWKRFIKTHYKEDENAKALQRKHLQTLNDNPPELYLFRDLHSLVKIYKDDFRSQEHLNEVFSKIDKEKYSLEHDKHAIRVLKSYIFNNNISLNLEKNSNNFTYLFFNKIYEEIRSFQHTNNSQNYHPWYKLSLELIKYIDNASKKSLDESIKIDSSINEIERINSEYTKSIELLRKTVLKLKETSTRCAETCYQIFQSPFDECVSTFQFKLESIGTINLFFKSSYIIPIDYSKIEEDVNEIDIDFNRVKSFSKTYTFLADMISKIQESNKELENNKHLFKQQERRSIEVLGIFSAIALFSIGSIQIFKDNAQVSFNNILLFLLAFGFGLSLFIYLIWIITRENLGKVHWYHYLIFIFYVISFFFIYKQISYTLNPFIIF